MLFPKEVGPLKARPQDRKWHNWTIAPANPLTMPNIQCGQFGDVTAARTASFQPSKVPPWEIRPVSRTELSSSMRRPEFFPRKSPPGVINPHPPSGVEHQPGRETVMIDFGRFGELQQCQDLGLALLARPQPGLHQSTANFTATAQGELSTFDVDRPLLAIHALDQDPQPVRVFSITAL